MKAVFLDFATVSADDVDLGVLKDVTDELVLHPHTGAEDVASRIEGFELVFLNKVRMNEALISQAASLKFIGLVATGVDNVDVEAARNHGIAVANIRDYCTQSVVEHIFAALLTLNRSIGAYRRSVREGAWQAADNFCLLDHPLHELHGRTLGIVGHGTLGKAVAETARAFGMEILIAGRKGASDERPPLDAILPVVDVLSLHCPLTDDTRGMIGAEQLALMKSDAVLINTARGALIDGPALVTALTEDRLRGAIIDVLPTEPPVDGDPLLDYTGANLILTPHIAWASREARQRAIDELAANVRSFRNGERRNRVD